jgi:hypothetical protein
VLGEVALGQGFPHVLRFSPVNFIPSVLCYTEKRKKTISLKATGASIASAAVPFTKKEHQPLKIKVMALNAQSEMRHLL